MAVYEFHIDVEPDWEKALDDSRAEYRGRQIKALVSEFPDLAYEALVEIGCDLTKKPDRRERDDRPSMLIRY